MSSDGAAVMRVIRERRSVGRVSDVAVPREVLAELLEAATWAPNHRLTNPWRFVVFQGAARDGLGDAHTAAVARANPAMDATALAAQRALTRRAPVIIACLSCPGTEDPVVRREDRDAVCAAIQNMLLMAHARGLGAIWRTGLFVDEAEVRTFLGCEDTDEIVGFVYLGVAVAEAPTPERRPVADVVEWRGV